MRRKVVTGNVAVAEAVKVSGVQVISAYPITPQTVIVERIAEMVERGEMKARYIRVESEHSALAAVYGASAGGARAFTATSSHGLLYMYEMLWWVAYSRLPIVMAVVTRAIGPPWNIHSDHHDALTARDSGWIIGFASSVQEAFDMTVQAFKIGEDPKVLLPVMVALEGFTLSHTAEPVDVPEEELVREWLPPREPLPFKIEPGKPFSVGNLGPDEVSMELRWLMWRAMERSRLVIRDVDIEYAKVFGLRSYGGLGEDFHAKNSDYVVVAMGAWSGDAKEAVERLRSEGYNVGLLRVRFFRPFPWEELREVSQNAKAVLVVDRAVSMGHRGVLGLEVSSALGGKVPVKNVIAGIGGVDVGPEDFYSIIKGFIEEYEYGSIEGWSRPEWYMPWMEVGGG